LSILLTLWNFTQHLVPPNARSKLDEDDARRVALATVAWTNLETALNGLQTTLLKQPDEEDEEEFSPPPTKRIKTENNNGNEVVKKKKKKKPKTIVQDPFNIWLHTLRKRVQIDEEDVDDDDYGEELKTNVGGKLSQLTPSGILNGLAGVGGGIVSNKKMEPAQGYTDPKTQIPTASSATFSELKLLAAAFHKSIQTRVEADVLVTTPIRIQQMLAPDVLHAEFRSIRRRIFDTVILGKGLGTDIPEDIPTAPSGGTHDIDKFKKCKSCGMNDQALFVLDRKNGDVICSSCGTVASESLMHEGSQFRKFEGEVDRNHHGDTGNPLMSNAHNMSTTLGGVQVVTGAGGGGFGSQKRGMETILRNAHAYTELNISQFGKGDRRTRTGYKDKQKKDAFHQMAHCGDALNLHEAVVQRAKEIFAGFRDDRELVQQFKGVIAACLCESFDQLSSAGRQILKQKEQEEDEQVFHNPRASRRSELHHANLAGRGGLLLDLSGVPAMEEKKDESMVANKLCSAWDLDDCRTWLVEASRAIAVEWMEERKNGVKNIPQGSQEELEGRLVEHAITLCDKLEAELNKKLAGTGGKRVVTPRVTDMAMLGIKWQHSHERGSGGKGGVGNSGNKNKLQEVTKGGRTAGQILIMTTAKKLGFMLKDPMAGEAIHKELRALAGRQEALKRKELRVEATRQRFSQMKRKPWLQARAELET
jgi:hypothetical protein